MCQKLRCFNLFPILISAETREYICPHLVPFFYVLFFPPPKNRNRLRLNTIKYPKNTHTHSHLQTLRLCSCVCVYHSLQHPETRASANGIDLPPHPPRNSLFLGFSKDFPAILWYCGGEEKEEELFRADSTQFPPPPPLRWW